MLKNRLLSIGVFLFALGIILSALINEAVILVCVSAVFVLCILLCTVRFFKKSKGTAVVLAAVFAVGSLFLPIYANLFVRPYSVYDSKPDRISGVVTQVGRNYCDITVSSSDLGIAKGTGVRIYGNIGPRYGDTLTFDGILSYTGNKPSMLSDDIMFCCTPGSYVKTEGSGIFYSFRSNAYKSFDTLNSKYSEFLKSVIFNDKSGFSEIRYDTYRSAGAAPFLAVSGLHVSVLVFSIYGLLSRLKLGKYISCTVSLIIAVFYGFTVGFSPSVTRAVIMIVFILASKLFMADSDSVTSLFAALFILLIANPYSLLSLSLELSFLATLAMICVMELLPKQKSRSKFKRLLREIFVYPFVSSIACFIFTLPVTVTRFETITLISPISSIVFGIVFTPLLWMGFLSVTVSLFVTEIPIFLSHPLMFLINLFEYLCEFFGQAVRLLFTPANIFGVAVAVIASLSVILLLLIPKRKIRIIAFCIAVFITIPVTVSGMFVMKSQEQSGTAVAYKAATGGCGIVAKHDGKTFYLDGGAGLDTALIYQCNITHIDTYIFTQESEYSAEDLEYAIKFLGVKNAIISTEASKLPQNLDFPVPTEMYSDICSFGSVDQGILLENGTINLYSAKELFTVSLSGSYDSGFRYNGLVFDSQPRDDDYYCDSLYTKYGILTDNDAQTVAIGEIIYASIVDGGKVEITYHES